MTDPSHLTGAVQRQYPTPSAQEPGWKNIELVDGHGCSPPCHPNQRFYDKNTGRLVQKGLQQVVQWPTPRVSDTEGGAVQNVELENGSFSRRNAEGTRWGVKLRDAVESGKWPTPTVAEANKIANRANYGQVGLSNHPNIVGTPDREPMAKSRHGDGRSTTSGVSNEGVLNPGWVAWLMGLPQNWVTLEPVSEESLAEWETRMADGSWWEDEHDLPRTVPSRKGRVNMLKALGNGIVPRTIPTFLNYARSN